MGYWRPDFYVRLVMVSLCVWSIYSLLDLADQLCSPYLDTVGAEAEALQRQLRSLKTQGHQVQPLSDFCPFVFLLLTEPHQSLFCIYHVPMQIHACYDTHVGVKGHLGIFSFLFEIELFVVHHCVCWDIWLSPPVCSSLLNTGAWGLQITHFALDFMWVLRI